jgi:hydrogenase maturation factor
LATAGGQTLLVNLPAIPIPPLAARICTALELDPLATIASGALLLTAAPSDAPAIRAALQDAGILCASIGQVVSGPPEVWQQATPRQLLPQPERDEIARLYKP